MEKQEKKPPLGVVPKKIWEDRRMYDLGMVIRTYTEGGFPIPEEIIKEYNELVMRK